MSLSPEVVQDEGTEKPKEDVEGDVSERPRLGGEERCDVYLWNPLLAWWLKRKLRKLVGED